MSLREYTFQIGRYGPGLTQVVVDAHSRFEAEAKARAQASRLGIAHPDLVCLGWEDVDERETDDWTRRWEEHDARTNPSGGDGPDE